MAPLSRNDVWSVVHAERRKLVDDLAAIPDDAWDTPSLCAGWDVHDVLAHQVYTAVSTRRRFLGAMARCRFDFDAFTARGVAITRRPHPSQTLDAMRAVTDRTDTPPAPLDDRLHELIVHGDGPEVTGPALSLLPAVSGRRVALDELGGPGLPTLRARG